MKPSFTLLLILFVATIVKAGDSIEIKMNKFVFKSKDSIEFSCIIPDYGKKGLAAVTLNVWIQDLEKTHTWKYRYPVLNGEVNCSLAIGDSIKPGMYAVNFVLQRGLFKINGHVKNNFSHTSLNYMMLAKGRQAMFNTVSLDPTGDFLVKNILFEDDAFFVFTPGRKVKQNDLFIDVATPLDSAFIPVAIFTQIIDVKPELRKSPATNIPYTFDFAKTFINTTLPDVVVTHKGKSKVQQYDDTYSTGLFKDDNARTFDGIDDYEIANSIDIPSFLQQKIPGLRVEKENNDRMIWRNEPVTVYVDEYRLDEGEPIPVYPSEVAMIKVYNPPAAMINGGTSFGGAVAIYTKKGNYENNFTRKFKFVFKGYTGLDSRWR